MFLDQSKGSKTATIASLCEITYKRGLSKASFACHFIRKTADKCRVLFKVGLLISFFFSFNNELQTFRVVKFPCK